MARWVAVVSTAYCLSGAMSDGSYVRDGSVASNQYPLGTVLQVEPAPTRRRYWVVRDRIGWGTQLDFWRPACSGAFAWGRRVVRVRRRLSVAVGRRHRLRARKGLPAGRQFLRASWG